MAVELATAYISLVPSTKGVRKAIAEEFGQGAEDAVDEAGKAGEGAGGAFATGFGAKAKLALVGAGVAIGGLLVKGTMDAIDRQASNAELAASLGLDEATAARVGQVAGDVWANNFGENIGQVNDAIAAISTNLTNVGDIQSGDLQSLSQDALTLSGVLGEDVGRAVRGVGQLLRTGLVNDSTEAFDLVTATAQRLPKEMRGELIDSIEEYSNQFATFGVTGRDAMDLVIAGVEGGARGVDGVMDSIKEFGLNITAGTKPAENALKELGLNIEDMQALIDQDQGATAFSKVARALSGLSSESDKARLYADLLGGTFEQVGNLGLERMSDFEGVLGDISGSTQDAADTLAGSFSQRLEQLKRKGFDALIKAGEKVLPVLEEVVGGVEAFIAAFQANDGDVTSAGFAGFMEKFANLLRDIEPTIRAVIGAIIDFGREVITFFSENQAALVAVGILITGVVVGAFIAWAVAAGTAAIATLALIWPFLLVGVAIAAIAAALIWAYENWDGFRAAVDAVAGFLTDTLWPALKVIADFIIEDLIPAVADIVGWLAGSLADNISNIADLFADLWGAGVELKDQLVDAFNAIVDFVTELPGRLLDAGKGMWDFITQPFEDAMNAIRNLWNDTVGGFSVTLPEWMGTFLPGAGGKGFTIPKLHGGGMVPGRAGEDVLILAQAGEQVISAADVRAMRAVEPADGTAGRGGINIGVLNTQPRPLLEQFIELQHLMPAAA